MPHQMIPISLMLFLLLSCKQKEPIKVVEERTISTSETRFDHGKDFLLLNYDCKTDVDDLHSVAAFATYKSVPSAKHLKYHAVAGAYGVQEGLYVPPNTLFELAFPGQWSDAHVDFDRAVQEVSGIVRSNLEGSGSLWIAEAGQSDFSAALIKALHKKLPDFDFKSKVHIVQHSDWNERVTDSFALEYVKQLVYYHKIPDGNAVGNGTPGFRSDDEIYWEDYLESQHLKDVWNEAIELANQYNGVEDRYLNESIAAGGLDFSDFSEVCWMMGLEHLQDGGAFFAWIKAQKNK